MVNAAATAVDWISSALKTGASGAVAPHALIMRAGNTIAPMRIDFFILNCSFLLNCNFVLVDCDCKFVIFPQGEFSYDLPAADPDNIIVISKRGANFHLFFHRIFKYRDLVWRVVL